MSLGKIKFIFLSGKIFEDESHSRTGRYVTNRNTCVAAFHPRNTERWTDPSRAKRWSPTMKTASVDAYQLHLNEKLSIALLLDDSRWIGNRIEACGFIIKERPCRSTYVVDKRANGLKLVASSSNNAQAVKMIRKLVPHHCPRTPMLKRLE